jgi:serine/threonine protein kinase
MNRRSGDPPYYLFDNIIGFGSFGTVFKAYDMVHSQPVAIKRSIKLGSLVSREYSILKEVSDCDQCVKILDIFYTINDEKQCIQHLVFEYLPENLSRYIKYRYKSLKPFNYKEIANIMKQILMGLVYIHNKNITHRDLKPENIIIDPATLKLKICDFGSAKKITSPQNTPYIVSRYYRAPELIFCNLNYNSRIDIWAAGCIFIELFTGIPAFIGKSEGDQFIKQAAVLGPPSLNEINKLTQSQKLMSGLVSKALRIKKQGNFIELFKNCQYSNEAADLARLMLMYDPDSRPDALECLNHQFFSEI